MATVPGAANGVEFAVIGVVAPKLFLAETVTVVSTPFVSVWKVLLSVDAPRSTLDITAPVDVFVMIAV